MSIQHSVYLPCLDTCKSSYAERAKRAVQSSAEISLFAWSLAGAPICQSAELYSGISSGLKKLCLYLHSTVPKLMRL